MNKITLLSLVLLTACSEPMSWTKSDDPNETQLANDRYQCMQQTGFVETTALQNMGLGASAAVNPRPTRPQDSYVVKQQLFVSCMQAKGYKLK